MSDETTQELEELLAKSASTDLAVLLSAKESAKRLTLEDPSPTNLAAFERASKLLEVAMQAKANLKDYKAVMAYAEESGRKLGQTKLYDAIKKGQLKKHSDGSFRLRDVERFLASLPMLGTADGVAEKSADRQRRKEEAEIKRISAQAEKEVFDLDVKKGKFIPRERVNLELAGRAMTLSTSIRAAFEIEILEIIKIAEGNPKKSTSLIEKLYAILDEAFNEYSRELEIEVVFTPVSSENSTTDEEKGNHVDDEREDRTD